MKTIYISDLDGTLLNPNAELSPSTREKLNALIQKNVCFTAATARTWATVRQLMEGVGLEYPVVLMNGVCLYDPGKEHYVKVEALSKESSLKVVRAMKACRIQGFVYKIINDRLETYYESLDSEGMRTFYEERVTKFHKTFIQVGDLSDVADHQVIYFSLLNSKEKLDPVFGLIQNDPSLHIEYYKDIYGEGLWYLEVSSSAASKAKACRWIKEALGFDRMVVFGDNYNDLSMFSVADEKIAVRNAVEDVKKAADLVIGPNTEDGVPEYLRKRLEDGNI